MPLSRNSVPALSPAILIGSSIYAAFVGLALALLPPVISIVLSILPLGLLFFNQTWDFRAPLRTLHGLLVCALMLFILWPRYLSFKLGGPDITPARLSYALLLGLWAVALLSPSFRRETASALGKESRLISLIGIYVLLRIASCFWSDAPLLSLYLMTNELLTAVLVLPLAVSICNNRSRIQLVSSWLLVAGIAVASLAVLEATLGHTLFANASLPGMKVDSEWMQQAIMDKIRGGRYRAQSTFSHPLLLAEFMVFEIPLAIYFLVNRHWKYRAIGGAALSLFLLAAIVTGARSSLAAIPVVVLLATILLSLREGGNSRKGVTWILTLTGLALGAMATAVLLAFGVVDMSHLTGKSALEISSTYGRLAQINLGLPLVTNSPMIGYGLGRAAYVLGFGNGSGGFTIDNYYLSLALESGIPALLVFILFSFGIAVTGYLRSLRDRSEEGLLKGILSISLLGLLIMKLILSISHNAPLLYLAIALIIVVPSLPEERRS